MGVMTKSEFMKAYINDMYKKRRAKNRNEADEYLISAIINRNSKVISKKNKKNFKGVGYGNE